MSQDFVQYMNGLNVTEVDRNRALRAQRRIQELFGRLPGDNRDEVIEAIRHEADHLPDAHYWAVVKQHGVGHNGIGKSWDVFNSIREWKTQQGREIRVVLNGKIAETCDYVPASARMWFRKGVMKTIDNA